MVKPGPIEMDDFGKVMDEFPVGSVVEFEYADGSTEIVFKVGEKHHELWCSSITGELENAHEYLASFDKQSPVVRAHARFIPEASSCCTGWSLSASWNARLTTVWSRTRAGLRVC